MVDPAATPGGIRWNEHKAGLEGVDKAQVQAIVTKLSQGSRFYVREQEKASALAARIAVVREEVAVARRSPAKLKARKAEIDSKLLPELEAERVSGRVVACIDFDCFFAAVEALDDPSLVGVPHAVGGSKNGVLSTASYEARRFGVRSAMPVFIAKVLCPQLRMVPARMSRYKEISKLVEDEVLAKFDPNYRMGSLDEAYLDVTHLVSEARSAEDVITELRGTVKRVTGGLTASVGVGPNRLVAKISADINKPDGQTIILPKDERNGVIDFMATLSLRKVPGIGRVSEAWLTDGIGISCVGDIYAERAVIAEVGSEKTLHFLLRSALGIGCAFTASEGDEEVSRKGISRQRSFSPERNEAKLMDMLHRICVMLEEDVQKAGVEGARTVTLKLKTSDFVCLSRSVTVPGNGSVATAEEFEMYGKRLLKAELPIELRLIGIGLQKLSFKGDSVVEPKNSITRYFKKDDPVKEDAKVSPTSVTAKSTSANASQSLLRMRSFSEKIGDRSAKKNTGKIRFNESRCPGCRRSGADDAQGKRIHTHQYVCPVCNSRCFKGLGLLNAHVDECLNVNSDAFRDAVKGSRKDWTEGVRVGKKRKVEN